MTDNSHPIEAGVIVVGVDTHKDVHVAVALDHLGRRLDQQDAPSTPAGLRMLLWWARQASGRRV